MKKFFSILSAVLALTACNKEKEIPAVVPEDEQTIVVDITIDRVDAFGDEAGTKATVKKTWDDGDVVYLFFAGIPAPKYIEMKYNKGDWTTTPKNGLTASDLSGDPTKKMTAVFLPYAYDATVTADENAFFVFDDLIYYGVFYFDFSNYTYDGTLQGHLRLEAPFSSSNEKLVHFDVSGLQEGHTYFLYQDNLKPIIYSYVSSTGGVSCNSNTLGMPLVGHIDGKRGIVSFSGLLTEDAAGKQVDYQFSIVDETASVIYTRDAGNHTISKDSAIGLGDLGDASKWTATEFVYMGIDNEKGERICWATKNLGAQYSWKYGDYYAWGETTGYAISGYSSHYTIGHNFWDFPPYELDANNNLLPQYDAAHTVLKGLWRMPTKAEFQALYDHTTHTSTEAISNAPGMEFTSTVKGYTDKSIFLPVAGHVVSTTPSNQETYGHYWSATEYSTNKGYYLYFEFGGQVPSVVNGSSFMGQSVRPVFTIGNTHSGSPDPTGNLDDPSDYPGGGDPFGF
jgi:uncharacterized protein (TIGR02145 family)